MAIDYKDRKIMVVVRYSTTVEPGVEIKFAFFNARNRIRRDIGMNTYVYDILHTIRVYL
jgi:hypothetical protein